MTDIRSNSPNPSPVGSSSVRPVLWVVLLVSGVANIVTVPMDINVVVDTVLGLITLSSGAALIVDHYKRRRR
ncbi:hypothetical protein [Saccharothrix coeruleofusca]|uniref:Uncharacterized protein n=1 Tax=Saccharothrix coeruleofusca TaxID=33919 RepID=A0A918ARU5_9PSEU|nr:hypothetical protein [Saccharothrix coeruleofusca]GGP74846.1 hypothetical protein GCM10010185_55400 [Saccharothrix coeruleofusca]